jgi:DNA-binding MarR family transcriptional regulator
MRMPVVEIGRRMLAALHEQGFDDLIQAHLVVLRWPGPDGMRPVEVAEQTGMSKQALNYLLGQLEEAGYLERVDDPDDRRSKRIRMTERGWAAGHAMRAAVGEVEQEFVDAHGKQELERLLALLTDLNVVLGTDVDTPRQAERKRTTASTRRWSSGLEPSPNSS